MAIRAPSGDARRRIVFVSYGTFDSNSSGHVFGFANGLAERGCAVAVCAAGDVTKAYSYGHPGYEFFSVADFAETPETLLSFDGTVAPEQTVILCWTPREIVRRAVEPAAKRFDIPYVVHLEDNEEHLTRVWREAKKRGWLGKGEGILPPGRSDPARLGPFLAGAAGATVIEARLAEVLPPALPSLVLEPGVDLSGLGKPLPATRAATIRRAIGVPADATLIVYPGNVHRANVEEMRALYKAVALLKHRGVMLVRTGTDYADAPFLKETGPGTGIVPLGHVERPFLIDLMKCADLFVQPGRPGPFNDYRLPSKLPEFMAIGRPIVLPATNVGTRLTHGTDAMLLQEGTAEEIVANVAAVLADRTLAARLAAKARAFAERHYRWDVQVEKLDAFLRQVT